MRPGRSPTRFESQRQTGFERSQSPVGRSQSPTAVPVSRSPSPSKRSVDEITKLRNDALDITRDYLLSKIRKEWDRLGADFHYRLPNEKKTDSNKNYPELTNADIRYIVTRSKEQQQELGFLSRIYGLERIMKMSQWQDRFKLVDKLNSIDGIKFDAQKLIDINPQAAEFMASFWTQLRSDLAISYQRVHPHESPERSVIFVYNEAIKPL